MILPEINRDVTLKTYIYDARTKKHIGSIKK